MYDRRTSCFRMKVNFTPLKYVNIFEKVRYDIFLRRRVWFKVIFAKMKVKKCYGIKRLILVLNIIVAYYLYAHLRILLISTFISKEICFRLFPYFLWYLKPNRILRNFTVSLKINSAITLSEEKGNWYRYTYSRGKRSTRS